ncbi:MAG TPA: hypothetical protein PKA13_22475 [Geminicoccaceae bacterium]|nr:hypothetical protein [Geminicoccus sp.]HMU52559.1 hypothetical protein [Geminicoccaceae bacterium]
MLGLSLGKILLIVAVIFAVWRAWRVLGPMMARMQQPAPPRAPERPPGPRPDGRALELVACPRCGTFIPAGSACPNHGPGRPA